MRTRRPGIRNHPTLVVLVLLLGLVLSVSLATLAVAAEAPGGDQVILTAMATVPWLRNGAEHNCEFGGSLHWILTPGGDATLSDGVLYVKFEGEDEFVPVDEGYVPSGQGNGAMHFDSDGSAQVLDAYVTFQYEGTPGNQVLTISHSICNTTGTSPPPTVKEVTTTVSESTTSTTGSTTTETSGTTTTGATTPETSGTTTTGRVTTATTNGITTSTSRGTTTSEGKETSTTHGGETTVPSQQSTSTSTTGYPQTSTPTPSQIQTGGGGTAGSGVGILSLAALAATLGVGLTFSALRARRKAG